MTLSNKQREIEIAYLDKEIAEIREELKQGENTYLRDRLKAFEASRRGQYRLLDPKQRVRTVPA